MYLIKNALKNLVRNKGRNVLLSVIILTLILSTTVALIINTTTKGIITDYKSRFGSKVTLSVDFDKLMGEMNADQNGSFHFPTAPEISSDQYLDFAKSSYLKSYQMNSEAGILLKEGKAIDEGKGGGIGNIGGDPNRKAPTAKLIGHKTVDGMTDFVNGSRKIIDGTLYHNKNECIISSDFAKENKLKVGSELKVMDPQNEDKEILLKVVGIYADSTKPYGNIPEGGMSLGGSYANRRNEVFVTMDTMLQNFTTSALMISAEYELKNPDLVKDFEKELRSKGLDDSYIVSTDENSYNKIIAPVVGLSKISMTFMWIILIVGGSILLFVTTMAIQERKYEIGVLRAMGMKKTKVARMLVIEILVITTVCLGAGLGIGNVVSQPVANSLIKGQVEAAKNNQDNLGFQNGSLSVGDLDGDQKPLSEIEVSLSVEAVLQISLVALVLAIVSSTTGVIFITKYEPMKILSERN